MNTFTIITSTLNALSLLKLTAESIFQQTSNDWQWVIIDGASDDGTKEWLNNVVLLWPNMDFISEPDCGIYYAWNKALPLVAGKWVIFLGAGDKLKNDNVFKDCINHLNAVPAGINLAYGTVEYIKKNEDIAGVVLPARWEGIDSKWAWCRPVLPNHQGVFHRSHFLVERGGFDVTYTIAGDTAMILPELMRNGAVELPLCVGLRTLDGTSLNPINRAKVLREVLRINRSVGLGSKRIVYQYAAFFYHVFRYWLARRI